MREEIISYFVKTSTATCKYEVGIPRNYDIIYVRTVYLCDLYTYDPTLLLVTEPYAYDTKRTKCRK